MPRRGGVREWLDDPIATKVQTVAIQYSAAANGVTTAIDPWGRIEATGRDAADAKRHLRCAAIAVADIEAAGGPEVPMVLAIYRAIREFERPCRRCAS